MGLDAQLAVPVINLMEQTVVQQIAEACTNVGFFYVSGHGVPDELVDSMFKQSRAFFTLSEADKRTILADANNRGFTPLAEETLDPARQSQGDTKEGCYFGREVPADSEEAQKPLHGPNQWPAESLVPGFRRTFEAYDAAVTALGLRLVQLVALSLGLEQTAFDASFDRPMTYLRPLHYVATKSEPSEGVYGCGAHCDYGMLTLLVTDDVPGLQVHLQGEWINVPPIPGTFIINLGDMLERWTNGVYRSTLHRVVNTSGRERYSTAFFLEPNFDALVECLPQCCSVERPARYPPVTAGQWVLDKYAATHAGYSEKSK